MKLRRTASSLITTFFRLNVPSGSIVNVQIVNALVMLISITHAVVMLIRALIAPKTPVWSIPQVHW